MKIREGKKVKFGLHPSTPELKLLNQLKEEVPLWTWDYVGVAPEGVVLLVSDRVV